MGITAASIDIHFHDHIIIGDGYYSMADNGYMEEIKKGFSNLLRVKPKVMDNDQIIVNKNNGSCDWKPDDWEWEIYWWFDFFNITFFKEQPVPVPVISFEKTRVTIFGHYAWVKNVAGIKNNINLSRCHLNRPFWEILATLLHQMTHIWQETYDKSSKNWFHNKEFTQKMMDFGIICADNGCHRGVRDPFVYLLKKHGIVFNGAMESESEKILKIPPRERPKGRSKLKKWSCGCTNVRVAVKEIEAKCLRCGNFFELVCV